MIDKLLKPSNWKKTFYYFQKNGLKAAALAALERLEYSENDTYTYKAPEKMELERQRAESQNAEIFFSILVPVYCTPEKYFREMVGSVLEQTYGHFELLLGDASPDDRLMTIVSEINDSRVKYIKIPENKGISDNTNYILERAAGAYIGLLDHDDVLTPDALYEMNRAIKQSKNAGKVAKLLYSDEDKGDGEMLHFYDKNEKPALDLDYLWSNNYICHFTVMEGSLMKQLRFRPQFDGAQDFDILLRAVREIEKENKMLGIHSQVVNISKVLYHWRCHLGSTAVNPQSKLYAYEAGKRAVEEDLHSRGIAANVSHSKHLGFYNVSFEDIFRDRPEVAMVAGPVYRRGRVVGGARNSNGELLYGGLRKGFSGGHLHRASVWQQCCSADFTNAVFQKSVWEAFLEERGLTPDMLTGKTMDGNQDRLREEWTDYVQKRNMLILYNPKME